MTVLYRYFTEDDRLLYVGISSSFPVRAASKRRAEEERANHPDERVRIWGGYIDEVTGKHVVRMDELTPAQANLIRALLRLGEARSAKEAA